MANNQSTKFGIFDFGFIKNSATFIDELNALLKDTDQVAEFGTFNKHFYKTVTQDGKIRFLNKYGYEKEKTGGSITRTQAFYAVYDTGFKDKSGNSVIGVFTRHNLTRSFEGIQMTIEPSLKDIVESNLLFRIGQIVFDNNEYSWDDAFSFLDDLADTAIPEKWTYGNQTSSLPHPILKAYVENIFNRLLKEGNGSKLLGDDNDRYRLFNLGLLNIYFRPIYLVVEKKQIDGRTVYTNPIILKKRTILADIGFTLNGKPVSEKNLPDPAQFFDNINDIIFKPEPEFYDPDEEKLHHIIEERRDRFPDAYKTRSITELAVIFDTAIKCSYELAKRNYKLVVPQYRPQENKIQYLMPLYLGATFNKMPDFALVLDNENGYYKPETILELDDAYQNARLIAKPDNFWLNPDQI